MFPSELAHSHCPARLCTSITRLRPSPKWKNTVRKGPLWSFGPDWIQEVQNGSENMFTQFSGQVSVSPESGRVMFTESFEISLKGLTHTRLLKIGLGTTPSSSCLTLEARKATWVPISPGPGRYWEAVGRGCPQKSLLRSKSGGPPPPWSIFLWAMTGL